MPLIVLLSSHSDSSARSTSVTNLASQVEGQEKQASTLVEARCGESVPVGVAEQVPRLGTSPFTALSRIPCFLSVIQYSSRISHATEMGLRMWATYPTKPKFLRKLWATLGQNSQTWKGEYPKDQAEERGNQKPKSPKYQRRSCARVCRSIFGIGIVYVAAIIFASCSASTCTASFKQDVVSSLSSERQSDCEDPESHCQTADRDLRSSGKMASVRSRNAATDSAEASALYRFLPQCPHRDFHASARITCIAEFQSRSRICTDSRRSQFCRCTEHRVAFRFHRSSNCTGHIGFLDHCRVVESPAVFSTGRSRYGGRFTATANGSSITPGCQTSFATAANQCCSIHASRDGSASNHDCKFSARTSPTSYHGKFTTEPATDAANPGDPSRQLDLAASYAHVASSQCSGTRRTFSKSVVQTKGIERAGPQADHSNQSNGFSTTSCTESQRRLTPNALHSRWSTYATCAATSVRPVCRATSHVSAATPGFYETCPGATADRYSPCSSDTSTSQSIHRSYAGGCATDSQWVRFRAPGSGFDVDPQFASQSRPIDDDAITTAASSQGTESHRRTCASPTCHVASTNGGYTIVTTRKWPTIPIDGANRDCRVGVARSQFCITTPVSVGIGSCNEWDRPSTHDAAPSRAPLQQSQRTRSSQVELKEPHVRDRWCALDTRLDTQGPLRHMESQLDTRFMSIPANDVDGHASNQSAPSPQESMAPTILEQAPNTRVVLCLDQVVPQPSQDRSLHEGVEAFQQLLQPWPHEALMWGLDFVQQLPDLTSEFRQWVQAVPCWSGEPIQEAHVYIDGSSYNTNRHSTEIMPAAWAFIVVLQCQVNSNDFGYRWYCGMSQRLASSGPHQDPPPDVGEMLTDALSAEATGMIWALAWFAQFPHDVPTCFHYDNCTIGPFTEGVQQWHATWEYHKLRSNITALRHFLTSIGRTFSFHHEKAHVGHPWSEVVDAVAKATAKRILFPLIQVPQVATALRSSVASFAWVGFEQSMTVPKLEALRATYQAEGPFVSNRTRDATWHHEQSQEIQELVTYTLGFASANVLSLSGGTMKHQQQGLMDLGRIHMLQTQFSNTNHMIIGLQECRTHEAICRHSSTHYVFQSGADAQGNRGCELWLNRSRPYAYTKHKTFSFSAQHVHIASRDDRHLLALIQAPHLHIRILVVHAPHECAQDAPYQQWWDQIQQCVDHTPKHLPLIVLGDMNARIGSIPSLAISQFCSDEESETGHSLHAFTLENELWAPSTFAEHHSGESHTWVSPKGQTYRLDFVLLPHQWKEFGVRSFVDYDVDLAMARHDHFVVATHVTMAKQQSQRKKMSCCRIDARKCQVAQNKAAFHAYLQAPPQIPWSVGVGAHAEQVIAWLQDGATQCFPVDHQLPRQKYLSDQTWQVVMLRKQLGVLFRTATRQISQIQRKMTFHRWLVAYKNRRTPPRQESNCLIQTLQRSSHLLQRQCLWTLKYRRDLHPLARFCSRQDRIAMLQTIADQFAFAANFKDTSHMYQALKPLLGQTHRKQGNRFRPIPAVKMPDGFLAATPEIAGERWRDFFAQPEHGVASSVEDIQKHFLDFSSHHDLAGQPCDLQAIPSLRELEVYILNAKRHKSPGLDGLSGDVYKTFPAQFARIFWPIMAKVAVRCEEPLRWKGGEICTLPKTAAVSHSVEKHRSILLADFASKLAHGVMRQKLLPSFESFRQPMQAGGVPKLGTDMLNLFVQAQAQHSRANGLSSAALYVDIRHAFYSACRPLVSCQQASAWIRFSRHFCP